MLLLTHTVLVHFAAQKGAIDTLRATESGPKVT